MTVQQKAPRLVATEVPPVPPVDERIEWVRDFFSGAFKVDSVTGRADYRERAVSTSVTTGEIIARIVPGQPGLSGVDIFGKTIPPAEPRKVTLRAGRNVTLDEASGCYVAGREGRLNMSDNILSVDETCEIAGNVGIETGNIKFAGHVSVAQDINDLSVVEAEGGVEVGGVIGAASVRSGADVVARAIAGGGKARIHARGALHASYINNAEVRTGAGVFVASEIVNSDVRTSGEVHAEEARIVGGRVVALGGIDAAEAGSSAATPTLLVAGEDHEASAFIAERESELSALRTSHAETQEEIARRTDRARSMNPKDRERVTEMMFRAQGMESRMEEVRREIHDRQALVNTRSCRRIRVRKLVHPRVTFRIAGQVITTETSKPGPCTVTLDASRRIVMIEEGDRP